MAATQGTLDYVPPKYYSIAEGAKYLHVSVSTMYKLTRTRQIRFIKTGKEIMLRQEFLDEYIESRVFAILPCPPQGPHDHVR